MEIARDGEVWMWFGWNPSPKREDSEELYIVMGKPNPAIEDDDGEKGSVYPYEGKWVVDIEGTDDWRWRREDTEPDAVCLLWSLANESN